MFSLLNENEHWSAIEGYEGRYAVSNMGRLYSHITNKILKGSQNNEDYLQVSLCKDGIRKKIKVHVLVGNAFIGKRENGLTFDHIDRNRTNNFADNIRLATRQEQVINQNVRCDNTSGEKNIRINGNSYRIQIRRNNKTVFDKTLAMDKFSLDDAVEERNRFLDNYV